MVNIKARNAEGVHELMVIGTALEVAKSIIEEKIGYDGELTKIDEALAIVENILDDGFGSI